jgi:hypothetical protein
VKKVIVALVLAVVISVVAFPIAASAHWNVQTGDECKTLLPSTFHGDPTGQNGQGLNTAGNATDGGNGNGVDPIIRPSQCD